MRDDDSEILKSKGTESSPGCLKYFWDARIFRYSVDIQDFNL